MKTWKQGFIGILAIIVLVFTFTACDDGKDTHTHTWGAWQSNATQHWKECSCGEKTGIANHMGNPCTVCGYETPTVPQPKTVTQAANGSTDGLAFDGEVKIETSDLYLEADWNAVVANVIAAFNAAYTGGNEPHKSRCGEVFAKDAGAKIVLVNNLANNWEVRDGEFGTLYLKTGSIATADYTVAVRRMSSSAPDVGKAAPPQGGVFFNIV